MDNDLEMLWILAKEAEGNIYKIEIVQKEIKLINCYNNKAKLLLFEEAKVTVLQNTDSFQADVLMFQSVSAKQQRNFLQWLSSSTLSICN